MFIIDFDGTITDVWERYYNIFNSFWVDINLSPEQYKKVKLFYNNDKDIVEALLGNIGVERQNRYNNYKKEALENIDNLIADKLIAQRQTLKQFFQEQDAIILTIRREPLNLFLQLKYLELDFLEKKTVILSPGDVLKKQRWVENNMRKQEHIVMIGDSDSDAYVGKLDNSDFYFVNTGLKSNINLLDKGLMLHERGDINQTLDFLVEE